MDNREKTTPIPNENSRGYTIDELLTMMEPQYRAHQNTIRECIAGLTGHAAQLAAQGREEQLPMFRIFILPRTRSAGQARWIWWSSSAIRERNWFAPDRSTG